MTSTENLRSRIALMAAHCAGMVDIVALPVWVGTLIARFGFDPQQAGALATLFLLGAVTASLVLAPRFHRLQGRWIVPMAYAAACAAFVACTRTDQFGTLALLHALGGLATGVGLSITHGTVALTSNPHRLFGFMQVAIGVFGIAYMVAAPQVIAAVGGPGLFAVFGAIMLVACVITALAFPNARRAPTEPHVRAPAAGPLPKAAWCAMAGISLMNVTQAMVFSFLERMGADRGFTAPDLHILLIVVGVVNLAPGAIAAFLQHRLDARNVVLAGATAQAALALALVSSTAFPAYAAAGAVFVSAVIFTHIFTFGLLARLDPSGRAVSATPAMMMIGAAVGPILGGTLVKFFGYGAIGWAALAIDVVAFCFYLQLRGRPVPIGAKAA
ncbi:MFS transporter [Ramlibacter henchirensis]|uniref:MFS transporter n=1 Tax=Ramlibacter henchirensis TaxID=204072 RepID=A0A4Z0BXY2_9BURK|nr:MFS transporter [Ramlibacter henchirensis]TFZ02779.1 MFS transporter [Ramlibacter henchirensis]